MGAEQRHTTMAYLTRNDIPYHYALADAFTIATRTIARCWTNRPESLPHVDRLGWQ